MLQQLGAMLQSGQNTPGRTRRLGSGQNLARQAISQKGDRRSATTTCAGSAGVRPRAGVAGPATTFPAGTANPVCESQRMARTPGRCGSRSSNPSPRGAADADLHAGHGSGQPAGPQDPRACREHAEGIPDLNALAGPLMNMAKRAWARDVRRAGRQRPGATLADDVLGAAKRHHPLTSDRRPALVSENVRRSARTSTSNSPTSTCIWPAGPPTSASTPTYRGCAPPSRPLCAVYASGSRSTPARSGRRCRASTPTTHRRSGRHVVGVFEPAQTEGRSRHCRASDAAGPHRGMGAGRGHRRHRRAQPPVSERLAETMRRRRPPAAPRKTFATSDRPGLRPAHCVRPARCGHQVLREQRGIEGRDGVWRHPDLIPPPTIWPIPPPGWKPLGTSGLKEVLSAAGA